MEKLSFLTSNRFIALVAGAVIFYLKSKGFIGDAEMLLVNTILGGFILVRTIDRASEQMGTPPTATTNPDQTGGDV